MDVATAAAILSDRTTYHGPFYGDAAGLAIGAGVLCDGIRFPLYDQDRSIYTTRSGLVCVLTHECDVEEDNRRPFNDDVLVCPIIQLSDFVRIFEAAYGEADLSSYLGNLATRQIMQLLYLPGHGAALPHGGVIFFNQMAHTKLAAFRLPGAGIAGAMSAFGLEVMDHSLRRHLFREKADRLSFLPPVVH